jgi:hypothetical protein
VLLFPDHTRTAYGGTTNVQSGPAAGDARSHEATAHECEQSDLYGSALGNPRGCIYDVPGPRTTTSIRNSRLRQQQSKARAPPPCAGRCASCERSSAPRRGSACRTRPTSKTPRFAAHSRTWSTPTALALDKLPVPALLAMANHGTGPGNRRGSTAVGAAHDASDRTLVFRQPEDSDEPNSNADRAWVSEDDRHSAARTVRPSLMAGRRLTLGKRLAMKVRKPVSSPAMRSTGTEPASS